MSRTKRGIPYKHYWGQTKKEAQEWAEQNKDNKYFYRRYLLHGTDTANVNPGTHEYFNRAHRVGRAIVRNKLRPHLVQDKYYHFDDSRYRRIYKQVWWEIY